MRHKIVSLLTAFLLGLTTPCLHAHPILENNSSTPITRDIAASIEAGDEFAEATLFSRASSYYRDALTALSSTPATSETELLTAYTRYQLAQVYLRSDNDDAALQVLQELLASPQTPQDLASNALYLQGIAYKNTRRFPEAKDSFERFLASSSPSTPLQQEAHKLLAHDDLMDPSGERSRALRLAAEHKRLSDAKKAEAIALSNRGDEASNQNALTLLEEINRSPERNTQTLYLEGLVAARLISAGATPTDHRYVQATQALKTAGSASDSTYAPLALESLGALHYRHGNYHDAEAAYLQLAEQHKGSPQCSEGWFWAAKCAEKLQKTPGIVRERKKNVYQNFPLSPRAAEAYLSLYSLAEYLQGDRTTIKHLQGFLATYPDSPLQIEAHYLLGMDLKRDRKTAEGKWMRKRNLTEAIDAFQEVDNDFNRFSEAGAIPEELREYFIKVRYQATLERALANLTIAKEAVGAKQKIYLEYAAEVFKGLISDLEHGDNPYSIAMKDRGQLAPIYEESLFGLAQTYIKGNNDGAAKKVFEELQEKYTRTNTTRSYYLSRVWYELAMISMRQKQPQEALVQLQRAEEAGKGDLLTTDQKLDLWIQQSLCYRSLGDYDKSLLLLSKAVNDDAVSSLRLKAMFLRAETYELQGRHELARKQLESLAKKGGYWTKQKMDVHHGK